MTAPSEVSLSSLSLLMCIGLPAHAQNADQLAKQLSNPIANLTSMPLQLNYDHGAGIDDDGERIFLNVQPVIPMSIGEDWNLISRTVLPIIQQHEIFDGAGSQFGIGDTVQSLFFSPKALTGGGWTWGVGPALLVPTATDDVLGSEKWAAGPAAVALRQTHAGWTYGALANHLRSFAGDGNRADISATYLQPFVARSLGQGRTVSASLESTYDWEAAQWTVPLNVGYSKVSRVGSQLVSYQGGLRYYMEAPDSAAEWGLRFTFTLLFPRR